MTCRSGAGVAGGVGAVEPIGRKGHQAHRVVVGRAGPGPAPLVDLWVFPQWTVRSKAIVE